MVDPMDDIVRQARQGSVSAIIQVLNEKLAGSGIRTRAMFSQGVLQLLCEGAKPDQLEQPVIVPQVRQILESLQPRHIRKANINCRVVREQQLLWLEEISRDPDNQLLWSEEITLHQPSFFQRLTQDAKDRRHGATRMEMAKTPPKRLAREKKVFWRGLVGGASLSLFLLLLGWATYGWLSPKLAGQPSATATDAPKAPTPEASPATASPATVSPTAAASTQPKPSSLPSTASAGSQRSGAPKPDPFAEAVRLAEATVTTGQAAQTSAEWLEVATRWQRASDLMSQVPSGDPRYVTAQDRVNQYRKNSETALQKAQSQ